jgi:hypothetical protein
MIPVAFQNSLSQKVMENVSRVPEEQRQPVSQVLVNGVIAQVDFGVNFTGYRTPDGKIGLYCGQAIKEGSRGRPCRRRK